MIGKNLYSSVVQETISMILKEMNMTRGKKQILEYFLPFPHYLNDQNKNLYGFVLLTTHTHTHTHTHKSAEWLRSKLSTR